MRAAGRGIAAGWVQPGFMLEPMDKPSLTILSKTIRWGRDFAAKPSGIFFSGRLSPATTGVSTNPILIATARGASSCGWSFCCLTIPQKASRNKCAKADQPLAPRYKFSSANAAKRDLTIPLTCMTPA